MSNPDAATTSGAASGKALQTVKQRSAPNAIKLFSGWFCPYAQRAWIALEAKQIDYEYVEVNPYEKPKELLDINPRGLVPALKHNDFNLYESLIIVDYIDEAFPSHPFLPPLSPSTVRLRATTRFWANHIDKIIPAGFIGILLNQEHEKQAEAAQNLLTTIKEFAENALGKTNPDGGLFLPSEELSLVDITFAPFAIRFEIVLKHYRGFSVPDGPELAWKRYAKWVEAIKKHPAVAATLSDSERYLQSYQRYADGTAQSKAAQAVRGGKTIY
ncbi:hypothetical protein HK097_006321 [Rhizophlyctis rosea]|uniref:Glutathione S-transferase n=1 Tax=Rhizophlyctis rosea TaxID=64517 RepID=A0AAD5SDD7_9FUNG|nr:hypothetical protein HK097_006321 [Rhizophlyctis rosea]